MQLSHTHPCHCVSRTPVTPLVTPFWLHLWLRSPPSTAQTILPSPRPPVIVGHVSSRILSPFRHKSHLGSGIILSLLPIPLYFWLSVASANGASETNEIHVADLGSAQKHSRLYRSGSNKRLRKNCRGWSMSKISSPLNCSLSNKSKSWGKEEQETQERDVNGRGRCPRRR